MKNVSIYGKKWLDLVFEGKNKEYGAYELREQEAKTSLTAFVFSVTGIVGVFVLTFMLTSFDVTPVIVNKKPIIITFKPTIVKPEEKKPETKAEVVKKTTNEAPDVKRPLVVAKKEEVVAEVKNDTELQKSINLTTEGTTTGTVPYDGKPTTSEGGGTEKSTVDVKGISDVKELDRQPMFPGGMQRFGEYVGTHFEKSEMEEDQTIKILVSFVIEIDGTMTDIKVNRKWNEKLDNEAIRVLKSLKTKWAPGYKDNHAVRTQFTLPIVVQAE
jgi:periplasmic protein TonB